MMMIKYPLIITLIAALVPIAMLDVPVFASIDQEQRIFIVGTGDTDPKEMVLKATNEDGETQPVSDFEITVDNIVSISENQNVRLFAPDNGLQFTKARTLDDKGTIKEIAVSDRGEISFAGYEPGIYVLDVILDDEFAYEALVVIGEQDDNRIQDIITRVNNEQVREVTTRTVFKFPVKKVLDVEQICLFTPQHPSCPKPVDGDCPEGWGQNENEQCFPSSIKCPEGFWRADDDETGACVKIPASPIYEPDNPFCVDDPEHIGCPGFYDIVEEPEPSCDSTPGSAGLEFPYQRASECQVEERDECEAAQARGEEETQECATAEERFSDDCEGFANSEECNAYLEDFETFCEENPTHQRCAEPTAEPEEPEPIECEEGFILELGECVELTANCGGVPCTPREKEDSTLEDTPTPTDEVTDEEPAAEETPSEEPTPEPEPEPEPEPQPQDPEETENGGGTSE